MSRQGNLFESGRLQMDQSIELTILSILTHAAAFEHWAIAWSGGKDSSTLVTLLIYLLLAGKVRAPKSLTVLYADTRLELSPLWFAACAIREELSEHADALAALGCELRVEVVTAALDERFFVYMLGRGVPPPSNTFRWCTPQIKIEPMEAALKALAVRLGFGVMVDEERRGRLRPTYRGHGAHKLLVLTGVRVGESAARASNDTDTEAGLSAAAEG